MWLEVEEMMEREVDAAVAVRPVVFAEFDGRRWGGCSYRNGGGEGQQKRSGIAGMPLAANNWAEFQPGPGPEASRASAGW
nr:hypothetical protein [Oryza sativa Japonica Group]BAD22206.1 hypothetical protein [Oryza sativa Japonica Group]